MESPETGVSIRKEAEIRLWFCGQVVVTDSLPLGQELFTSLVAGNCVQCQGRLFLMLFLDVSGLFFFFYYSAAM